MIISALSLPHFLAGFSNTEKDKEVQHLHLKLNNLNWIMVDVPPSLKVCKLCDSLSISMNNPITYGLV